jgi:hypothetical protein
MTAEPIELHADRPHQGASAGCHCGHEDSAEIVLDTRDIPHAVRHGAIFGALGAIAPGFSRSWRRDIRASSRW